MLNFGYNRLVGIPDELSSMTNLKQLEANNRLPTVPVSALRGITALTCIRLESQNCSWPSVHVEEPHVEGPMFKITSSLLPILHPRLVKLDLRQPRYRRPSFLLPPAGEVNAAEPDWVLFKWDAVSMFHLGRALIAVGDRKPPPTLLYRI